MNALWQMLTEVEKIQLARDLRDSSGGPDRTERRRVQLFAGVEIVRFDDGGGVRARDIEKEEATDGDGR
jgi:hypothetical protein